MRRGVLASPPALVARRTNPRCGDVVTMYADVDLSTGLVAHVLFDGVGCTLSQAAADMVAEFAEGQPITSLQALDLGDLLDGFGMRGTSRLDCAGLGLATLQQALVAA